MPLARCLYCGELAMTSLWHGECEPCFYAIVLPAIKRKEKFVPVPGSLMSVLPDRVKPPASEDR